MTLTSCHNENMFLEKKIILKYLSLQVKLENI